MISSHPRLHFHAGTTLRCPDCNRSQFLLMPGTSATVQLAVGTSVVSPPAVRAPCLRCAKLLLIEFITVGVGQVPTFPQSSRN